MGYDKGKNSTFAEYFLYDAIRTADALPFTVIIQHCFACHKLNIPKAKMLEYFYNRVYISHDLHKSWIKILHFFVCSSRFYCFCFIHDIKIVKTVNKIKVIIEQGS